jgi:hypothetical protein
VFNQFGDLERCALRPGNVHSADEWDAVLKPVVARYQGKVSRLYFRADAAFAMPEVYEFLETEWIKYAIRRRLSDGGGRHPTANVPGDFAVDCGTTAATATRASIKRPIVTRSSAIERRGTSKCQRK